MKSRKFSYMSVFMTTAATFSVRDFVVSVKLSYKMRANCRCVYGAYVGSRTYVYSMET